MNQGRYVIQEHTTPTGVHWDLMLEHDDCLLTWRLNVPPQQLAAAPVEAVRIFDHPLRFLTYEGPVQQETGQVRIVDAGVYTPLEWTANTLTFTPQGRILTGTFQLEKQNEIWQLKQIMSD